MVLVDGNGDLAEADLRDIHDPVCQFALLICEGDQLASESERSPDRSLQPSWNLAQGHCSAFVITEPFFGCITRGSVSLPETGWQNSTHAACLL